MPWARADVARVVQSRSHRQAKFCRLLWRLVRWLSLSFSLSHLWKHFFEVSLLCEDQLFFAPWPMYCSVLAFFFTSSRLQVVSTSFAPVVLMVKGVKFLLPTHHESQPLG